MCTIRARSPDPAVTAARTAGPAPRRGPARTTWAGRHLPEGGPERVPEIEGRAARGGLAQVVAGRAGDEGPVGGRAQRVEDVGGDAHPGRHEDPALVPGLGQ